MKRLVLICLLALAGCGSSSGAPADPASIAPAGTLAYASVTLSPEGAEGEELDAALGRLLGPAPETKLRLAFTKFAQTSGRLDYLTDIRPWLGDSLAVVVTRVGRREADFALLAESKNDDEAREAIEKDLAGRRPQSASYRGHDYELLDGEIANAVVGGFLVAGTEAAFKSIVDAVEDGKTLAEAQQWKTSVAERGDGKTGLAYVDVKALLQSAASGLPGPKGVAIPLLLGMIEINPVVATLDARRDALVVDAFSPGTAPDPRGPAAASSPLIDTMPADAWAAAAIPDVGAALGKLVTGLRANPLIASHVQSALARVKAHTGIDFDRDLVAGLGDLGGFVRGTTHGTVAGAVLAESSRPARLAAALRKMARAHRRKRLHVQTASGRVVAAGTAAAARAALRPGELGGTQRFRAASELIGQRPTLFLAFDKALTLAAASPHHQGHAGFRRALPILRRVSFDATGVRRDGRLDVVRTVVGLR